MLSKSNNLNPTNNHAGFSLLEVLIAIAILSILMVSIYQIIDNSADSNIKIQREDRDLMQLESALSLLESDIEFISSPLYYESTQEADEKAMKKAYKTQLKGSEDQYEEENYYEKTTSELYSGYSENKRLIPLVISDTKSDIAFLTSSGRRLIKDSDQSNLLWVRYRIVDNPDNENNKEAPYMLTRTTIRDDLYNINLDFEGQKEYVILKDIAKLEFHYWDMKAKKFVDSLKLLNEGKQTPRLIKLVLSYKTEAGESYEGERTFRPLYPIIDTDKLLEKKYTPSKSSGPTGGQKGGSQEDDQGEDGGFTE